MRGSDPNVQWFFRMENATISISLLDLFQKRFHATRVRAEGLVFRLREKQKKSETSAPHAALLPPIAGFSISTLATLPLFPQRHARVTKKPVRVTADIDVTDLLGRCARNGRRGPAAAVSVFPAADRSRPAAGTGCAPG